MVVNALVIVGGADPGLETVAGLPVPTLDLLGKSVLQRVIDRLRTSGVRKIFVVSQFDFAARNVSGATCSFTSGQSLWRVAEKAFNDLSQSGCDLLIIHRLGAYVEIDFAHLVRFHLDHASRLTTLVSPQSDLLGIFVIPASRRNDAAYLLRHGLRTTRPPHTVCEFGGYSNRLENAADLRKLVVDSFCGNASLRPAAPEVRPGIWIDPTALVDKRARVLAPCFIGAHARIRPAAVVTRCTAIEHHSVIDSATIVENATLLPHTSLGPGLDVAHAVVGQRRIIHLGRETEVEIFDPRLVGVVSPAPLRLLGQVASLAGFLPAQFLQGFRRQRPVHASLSDAIQAPAPELSPTKESQFPGNLAVARRYGDE